MFPPKGVSLPSNGNENAVLEKIRKSFWKSAKNRPTEVDSSMGCVSYYVFVSHFVIYVVYSFNIASKGGMVMVILRQIAVLDF